MHILSRFGENRKRSAKIDEQLRPTMADAEATCAHSGLTAEDWLDLQLLAQGKFLPRDLSRDQFVNGLVNWTVEVRGEIARAALARLVGRGFARSVGPADQFARLTPQGVTVVERAMRHAVALQLARA